VKLSETQLSSIKEIPVCAICNGPFHKLHTADTAYLREDPFEVLAVVNNGCSASFDQAFRATFSIPTEVPEPSDQERE
jgi:hypothetical protein